VEAFKWPTRGDLWHYSTCLVRMRARMAGRTNACRLITAQSEAHNLYLPGPEVLQNPRG
jgi:hypothetical protein